MTPDLTASLALELAHRRLPQFVDDLALLVGIDSGSTNPLGVNKVADVVAQRLTGLGWAVTRQSDPTAESGDVVVGRRRGAGTARVLMLAHMDTVFGDGIAAERPFTVRGTRGHGPGVADDKGGLLAGVAAAGVLADAGVRTFGELVFCATPDEEVGSPSARDTIADLAAEADWVLCLECAREDGSLVSARKGIVDITVDIRGRAAHSGIEPERGASAALAAARFVLAVDALNASFVGVSVNVGRIEAGGRSNVIPDAAQVGMEARARTAAGLDALVDAVRQHAHALEIPGTTAEVQLSAHCPPLEPSASSMRLADLARTLAAEQGLNLATVATGGAADANYAAATGTPTLDGLGPIGGNDHSCQEWLDLESVVPRVALLARLIARLSGTSSDAR